MLMICLLVNELTKMKFFINKELKVMLLVIIAILSVVKEDLVVLVGIKIMLVIGVLITGKNQKNVYGLMIV